MGAWGTAIFAEDVACDVRDAYRQLGADGLTGPEATNRLFREWKEVVADEDDGPLFWLALAATQWQCGRLEARIKARALKTIANGSSLGLWSEEGGARDLRQRKAVLERLGARLQSPQPPAKQFRKPPGQCRLLGCGRSAGLSAALAEDRAAPYRESGPGQPRRAADIRRTRLDRQDPARRGRHQASAPQSLPAQWGSC
jgi:hypothetical protein